MASKPNKKPSVGDSDVAEVSRGGSSRGGSAGGGRGKPLVIVESPAKARTISKYLGSGYTVEASIGHVRDLPESAEEIPPEVKKEKWARLGVDVDHDFAPLYVVPARKREQVRKLKKLLTGANALYLATDEDREGESISWHLLELLKPKVPVYRLVFHEITKQAIEESLETPRSIDDDLVRAQETRRIVDRLYGYEVSPLLWKKIRPRLSAGRVQSVAIRLVVERERQRMQFRSSTWWDLLGTFATSATAAPAAQEFEAELVSVGGKRIATGKDFDPSTGEKKGDARVLDEKAAKELAERLQKSAARVDALEAKPFAEGPYPPFTTSTLQQEANRKLRFTARRTMEVAQRLYENGLITYMRTDSTNLSTQAVSAARELIASRYGTEYLSPSARHYQTKVKNAQEAHEAIRPAGAQFRLPEEAREDVQGDDELRLYELIWKRTVACQMADARGQRITLSVAAADARFEARGKTIEFPGYLMAYVEGSDDPEADLAERERVLPSVKPGDPLDIRALLPREHKTQPPPRLTEATLVKELESRGIGRPSTYATIIDPILRREYVFKRGNALVPTFTAFAVVRLMEQYLGHLVDYGFTARMEDDLDRISLGQAEHQGYLRSFYFGDGEKGLKPLLTDVEARIDPRTVCTVPVRGSEEADVPIEVRIGRYGPFLSSGDKRVGVPEDLPPDELDAEKARELLSKEVEGPRELGTDPETGLPVFVRTGRFGPYLQLGKAEGGNKKKPKMASLLPGMEPDTVTLETALALLALPRELGRHPESSEPVLAASGRFGPYVKCGADTRSIPEGKSVLTLTLAEALHLLSQPKAEGKRRFGRAIQPLKELGKTPQGAVVKLMSGRYGPYVTDGALNASLPRGQNPDAVTLERAIELLKERAEKGPARPKHKSGRKSGRKPASRG